MRSGIRDLLRSTTVVVVLGVAGLMATAGSALAEGGPNEQDKAYMASNAQTSLAEISLAKIAMNRAQATGAQELATMTMADHQAALTKLQGIAAKIAFVLPTEPSPAQQATAAKLQNVPAAEFDIDYASAQVMGHHVSIANTNIEATSGSNADVVAYAKYYLPVAQKHLDMANALVASLGGATPSSVPAGTGGQGASSGSGRIAEELTLAGAGVLLLGFGAVALLRRRSATS